MAGGAEQFAAGPAFNADVDELVFRVGVDDDRTSWPSYQPGPLTASTGYRPKRVVIVFDLDAAPASACELRVRLLAAVGPVPEVDVEVNGRVGRWYLDPVRDERIDLANSFHIGGWDLLRIAVDASWLRAGENRIALITVQEQDADPAELGPMHPEHGRMWGSLLRHGGVELVETGRALRGPSARIAPTPLYVEHEGRLNELVDVVVSAPSGFTRGALSLAVDGGMPIETTLQLGDRAFGQVRARLLVPDLDEQAREALLDVRLDGDHLHETVVLRPCRRWTVHVLPHVHLDIGYTDLQAKVAEVHSRNLDRALRILEETPDYRFSIDGSFAVEQFAASRSATALTSVLDALRSGTLSVNAFFALFLTGLASLEECYRAGYGTAALRRQHGIPVDYANLTDVPSYSSAIPSMLHAMGIDGFVGIQNHTRAASEDSDVLHLVSPFVWEGPDGARVLTFFADCYSQLRAFFGHPTTVVGAAESLGRLLRRYDRDDYLPRDFPIVGIHSDNEDLGEGQADFVARWNATYAYPRLRFGTMRDYLAAVEPLRDRLPVVRGDGGSFWEDGVGASASVVTTYRRAQALLPVAEACSVLVTTVDPALRAAVEQLDQSWRNLLIGSEHTWTWMHVAAYPHGEQVDDQLHWKRRHIEAALGVATDEMRRAMSQLGELVQTDGPSLLLFNGLSWERSGVVDVELPVGTAPLDDTGAPAVVDIVSEERGLRRVRLRTSVPAFGYRRLHLAPTLAMLAGPSPVVALDGGVVETGRYRLSVDVDSGRIVSLWSRSLDRELLDVDRGAGLAEVIYVRRSADTPPDALLDFSRRMPAPDLTITPAAMTAQGVRRTPWGAVLSLTGQAPSLPRVDVEVELYDDDDRVDVRVAFDKSAVYEKESVYVAFPFAVDEPALLYDRQQGWVNPVDDHAPGACNEWFTTQSTVVLRGDDVSISWSSPDAPLFCVGDVVRGRWPRRFPRHFTPTLLSWVMNNHWWTNFAAAQEGAIQLRYAFTPAAKPSLDAAARFGREARTPLVASQVTWLDKMDTAARPLPGVSGTLLDVEATPNVVVSVAQSRVGDGLLLRVQETAGQPGHATIRHPFGPAGTARRCSAVEDLSEAIEVHDGVVPIEVGAHQVVSLHLARS